MLVLTSPLSLRRSGRTRAAASAPEPARSGGRPRAPRPGARAPDRPAHPARPHRGDRGLPARRATRAPTSSAGRTPRVAPLYGPAGNMYVYFVYGMHHCLNLAVDREGRPGCVLIRAAELLGRRRSPRTGRPPGRLPRPGPALPDPGPHGAGERAEPLRAGHPPDPSRRRAAAPGRPQHPHRPPRRARSGVLRFFDAREPRRLGAETAGPRSPGVSSDRASSGAGPDAARRLGRGFGRRFHEGAPRTDRRFRATGPSCPVSSRSGGMLLRVPLLREPGATGPLFRHALPGARRQGRTSSHREVPVGGAPGRAFAHALLRARGPRREEGGGWREMAPGTQRVRAGVADPAGRLGPSEPGDAEAVAGGP